MRPWRVTLSLAVLAGLFLACSREPAFRGTALDPPRETLDFTLHDQRGQPVRLSDLRGRVVFLTFFYTACTDICPLVTQKIRKVTELLGNKRREVSILVVTVDPERDTVARAAEYSRNWGMLERWRFLSGSESELEPVWRYYWVGELRRDAIGSPETPSSAYEVQHTAPVHLIDQRGRVRVVYGSSFRPAQLAHDIEALLKR